jgi:hypothetical protein
VEPLRPLARYSASWKNGSTGKAHVIQVLTFNPGALAAFQHPHPLSDFGTVSGYPVVIVVNDPTFPPGPDNLTDTCTPTNTRVLLWGMTRDNPCTTWFTGCNNSDIPCPGCGSNIAINTLPSLSSSTPPVVCNGPDLDESGCVRYANPSATGTHPFYVFQQSARDLDSDGYENPLDSCPQATNVQNPRTTSGPDGDMLDSACDPVPGSFDANQDVDSAPDGTDLDNAGDNCPLISNADQKESELLTKWSVAAKRGGSRADAMGDACETGVNDTIANGHFHSTWTVIAKCIGATDTDGDGWCNTEETNWGSSITDVNKTPEHYDVVVPLGLTHSGSGSYPTEVRGETAPQCGGGNIVDDDGDTYINDGCTVFGSAETALQCFNAIDEDGDFHPNDGCPAQVEREPRQVCGDGIDNDGDTLVDLLDVGTGTPPNTGCRPVSLAAHPGYPSCPTNGCPGIDTDGDGYTDEAEMSIGTDALGRCEAGATPPMSTDWPSDIVSGGTPDSTDAITITDLTSFLGPIRRLDTYPGHADFDRRWDLVPGPAFSANWIEINDLTALSSGVTGEPPMNNSAGVFGTSFVCSAHPMYGD